MAFQVVKELIFRADLLEYIQAWRPSSVSLQQGILVLARYIQSFEHQELGGVILAEDLIVSSGLVSESAQLPKEADLVVEEASAVLGLELVSGDLGVELLGKLTISVGELALRAVFAHADIHPVFAKLSLVLVFILSFST